MKRCILLATLPALVFASACSPAGGGGSAGEKKPVVYTSTNVWGSVAKAVGGDLVDVHSSLTRPEQDPHDYEVTAQDKNQAQGAAVIIVNGGGYDDWAVQLGHGSPASIINAVDLSGLKHDGDKDFNEHVFYNLDAVRKVSDEVARDLSAKDAPHAATYAANAKAFGDKLDTLKQNAAGVGQGRELTAFATEPVVGYLLQDMGVDNITPDEFVEESETQAGPSTKAQAEAQNLVKAGRAKLLVVNGQTETNVTKALAGVADAAHVPVVRVTETFPDGVSDYATWVQQTIDAFASAAKQVQ